MTQEAAKRDESDEPDESRGGSSRARLVGITGLAIFLLLAVGVAVLVAWLGQDTAPSTAGIAPAAGDVAVLDEAAPEQPAATASSAPSEPIDDAADPRVLPPGFADLGVEISEVRELPVTPFTVDLQQPDALGAIYNETVFSELDPEQIESDRRLLVDLHLVRPDLDYLGVVRALYGEQVNGFYDPETDVLHVGDEAAGSEGAGLDDLSAYKQVTAAHEIDHALQDGAYDLTALREVGEEEADRSLAVLALIEGDATLVQEQWSERFQTPEEREAAAAEAGARSYDAYLAAPPYLQAALGFPYVAGTRFVRGLYDAGGWEAVDAAFAAPPTTSEQVIHPEKYAAKEPAATAALAGSPGAGWAEGSTYQFGEFDVQQLMAVLGTERAQQIAAGWGGGEVRSWDRGDEHASGLALTWDTQEDQTEMCAAVPEWWTAVADGRRLADLVFAGDTGVMAYRCDETGVQMGFGPDTGTARAVAGI